MTELDHQGPAGSAAGSDASETLREDFEAWAKEEEHVDLSDISPLDIPLFVGFWALFLVVLTQFIMRYVFNNSPAWTEEIARTLVVITTFLGAFMAVRKNSHLAVDLLQVFVRPSIGRLVDILVAIIVAAVFALLTWQAARLSMMLRQPLATIPIAKSTIYWIVTAGFALCTIYSLRRLWLTVLKLISARNPS